MSKVRLRAPKGASSISHNGTEFFVEDGHIVVPEAMKAVALSLGYGEASTVASAEQGLKQDLQNTAAALTPEAIANMDREALVAYCEDRKLPLPEGRVSDKALRELVLAHATETLTVMKAASQT